LGCYHAEGRGAAGLGLGRVDVCVHCGGCPQTAAMCVKRRRACHDSRGAKSRYLYGCWSCVWVVMGGTDSGGVVDGDAVWGPFSGCWQQVIHFLATVPGLRGFHCFHPFGSELRLAGSGKPCCGRWHVHSGNNKRGGPLSSRSQTSPQATPPDNQGLSTHFLWGEGTSKASYS
jgi:hypothetical protein